MLNSEMKPGQTPAAGRTGFLTRLPLKVCLTVSLVAGMVASCCYLSRPRTPEDYARRAVSQMQRKQFREAVGDFKVALELLPNDCGDNTNQYLCQWSCHSGLATSYLAIGNYGEAIRYSSKALAAAPQDVEMYTIRALAYTSLGDWQKSLDDWQRRLDQLPDDPVALAMRGKTRCELKDYAGALADYQRVMRLQPTEVTGNYGAGYVHYRSGEYSKAIPCLDRAIHIDPEYAKAYHLRGFLHYRLGDYERAEDDFQRAISMDPSWKEHPYTKGDDELTRPTQWTARAMR